MKKRLSTIMAMVMALGMVFTAGSAWAIDASDAVQFTLDNPQAITISSPVDQTGDISLTSFAGNTTLNAGWLVTSNNGFDINFTGTSQDDDNSGLSYPQYSKQDVNAGGTAVADNYDHLNTTFGVKITGQESVETLDVWGEGATASGTPENLVLGLTVANGPDKTIGTIMTSDDVGTATVTLSAKGTVPDAGVQSGNYVTTVTCTVTADEKTL